jgi:thiol-disulfide isomerase/thioredoxin
MTVPGRCIFCHFLRAVAACCLLAAARMNGDSLCRAEDAPASFSRILSDGTRKTFDAAAAYVKTQPEAPDAERAWRWLFETARVHGWEADALPLVEQYLARDPAALTAKGAALQVQVMGLARSRNPDGALTAFDEAIAGVSVRNPGDALDLAASTASVLQASGKGGSARDVYDRLSRRFFLNPGVRDFCELRSGKLELLGKEAPQLGIEDLEGKSPSWEDYRGKLVLVDFWATNCPPCLEEFPMLKQLHAEYHKQGFDVIGITLDEDKETVDAFQERAKLPWRLALSRTDRDATRERFKAVKIPSMFLVDEEGKIITVDVRGEELKRFIERRLSGGSERPAR